jgi:ribonuclease HII
MIESKLIKTFPHQIIALDEVGRSPLCGPVVIGAIQMILQNENELMALLRSLRRNGVKDSKALNFIKRQILLKKFSIVDLPFRQRGVIHWKGVEIAFISWEMDHTVIDSENIYQASMRGMKESAAALLKEQPFETTILIDGQSKIKIEKESVQEIPIVKGDVKSVLIGLASNIAKEKRDAFMRTMHLKYPCYGLDRNFGYPTKFHRMAIEEFGPCEIHRKTFNKVKEFTSI